MLSLLYIDDEPEFLEMVKAYLEEIGNFSVDTAQSGPEGLGLLEKQHYDAIISDYQMPGMDGIALLKKIRALYADIPVIFFTGKGREDVVIDALNAGADGYIQKGGDPDPLFAELAHRTRQLIGKKQAEEALRDSEERFRGMAERSSDVIIISDENGRITYVSPSVKTITGTDPRDLIGNPAGDLFPDKEDTDRIYAVNDCDLNGESLKNTVLRMRKKDGSWAFLEVRVTPIFRDSKFYGVQLQGHDITQRKRAEDELRQKNNDLSAAFGELAAREEELRQNYDQLAAFRKTLEESEARFRALFMISPDGIVVISLGGRIMFTSPEALNMFRVSSPEEVVGTSIFDWIEPEYYGQAQDGLVQLFERKCPHPITYLVRRRDGSSFYVETSKGILPDANGNPDAIMIILRDITDRQNAESILRESEEKFRTLVEYSLDGILILDLAGTLLFANSATAKLIETENITEMFGKRNVIEFIDPESRTDVLNDFCQVGRGIDGYIARYKLLTAKGSEAWVECIGKKIRFDGKSAILISLRDISSRKRMEDAVLRTNRQLNLLSSITRHDVLNKISVIQGYLSLARKRGPDQDYPALLAKIQVATSVIKSQIVFTRVYQALGTKEPIWQKPADLVSAAYIPDTVVLQNELGNLEIYADLMLENVFHNLVENSLRHGENVTKICLTTHPNDSGISLVFEDNGTGIPASEKEQIFERGYGKNTGLGLFLVREILGITGILIKENGEAGKGARFEIFVPKGAYRFAGPDL
jgi:PAS domain S-box-containing protein